MNIPNTFHPDHKEITPELATSMKRTAHRIAAKLALTTEETFRRTLESISREMDNFCECDESYQGSWFTTLIDRSNWWIQLERKRIRAELNLTH